MRVRILPLVVVINGILTAPAGGQGLPAYRAINPVVSSRSGLGFLPLLHLRERWGAEITLDYASLIEVSGRPPADYLLDAEVLRVTVTATRSAGRRGFVQLSALFGGAYPGFLDGPLKAYHDLIGVPDGNRVKRPSNRFAYRIRLPDLQVDRPPTDGYLGDIALGGGVLLTPHWQVAARLVLPTSTAGEGYGLGAVAVALTTTLRAKPIRDRLTLEASAGGGYTPRAGDLAEWQRTVFGMVTGGARVRFWGLQSVFMNAVYHSPVYRRTGFRGLDGDEVSLDFGFLFRPGTGGPEILAGLTEDLSVGPAVDVVIRLGVRW